VLGGGGEVWRLYRGDGEGGGPARFRAVGWLNGPCGGRLDRELGCLCREPRQPSSRQRALYSKIIIKIANRCEKLPKFNMTPVRLYITYKKVFKIKLKFEFFVDSKPSDINSNS
jgi:hypothetical protein